VQTNFNLNNIRVSKHAKDRIAERGFTLAILAEVLRNPESVYEAHKAQYAGQLRINGKGMSVSFDPKTQTVITVFFNTILDPDYPNRSK
jgi:hypothetical protein